MFLFYSFIIRVYGVIITLAASFNPKARLWKNGRKNQLTKISSALANWKGEHTIWIHVASYGEYDMALPIIDELKNDHKNRFLISFYSPSGYENIEFQDKRFLKIYLPLDSINNQRSLIELIKPDKVVFIKYDFWFNLLRALQEKDIPYFFTSLHLNADSYLFYPFMRPFTNMLRASNKIYCHNEHALLILKQNDFKNAVLMGDTRIQRVLKNSREPRGKVSWLNTNVNTIGVGSMISSEHQIIIDAINSFPDSNFIIAPHDVAAVDISAFTKKLNESYHLYSKGSTALARILIVDTLGDLKYLYRNCNVVYVGAGFEKGPHNVLEPLVYGIPTCCGGNISKFPMARELNARELLTVIDHPSEVGQNIERLQNINPVIYKEKVEQFFNHQSSGLSQLISDLKSK